MFFPREGEISTDSGREGTGRGPGPMGGLPFVRGWPAGTCKGWWADPAFVSGSSLGKFSKAVSAAPGPLCCHSSDWVVIL